MRPNNTRTSPESSELQRHHDPISPLSSAAARLEAELTAPARSRRVHSDADRRRVLAFFTEQLLEVRGFPLPGQRDEEALGTATVIRIAESPTGEIEAAIFASDDPAAAPRHLPSSDVERARSVTRQTLMIHALAVGRGRRRRGLGRVLVREVLDAGRSTDVSVVTVAYDDRTPGLDYFWGRMGFTLLADSMRLIYAQYPGQTVEFPVVTADLRWGYQVLRPRRVMPGEKDR